jgi:hypothetical protein
MLQKNFKDAQLFFLFHDSVEQKPSSACSKFAQRQ